jgi:hypothetical protein
VHVAPEFFSELGSIDDLPGVRQQDAQRSQFFGRKMGSFVITNEHSVYGEAEITKREFEVG